MATPAVRKKSEAQASKSWVQAAFDVLRNNLGKVIVSSVPVGVLGFFLSPLKPIVFHWIWHEEVVWTVQLQPKEVFEGQELEMDITLGPGAIAIAPGTMTVDFPQDRLKLLQPLGTIQIDAISERKVAATLKFHTLSHGTAAVSLHFVTRYGSYENSQQLLVRDPGSQIHPSKENLSGIWNFRMNNTNGELHIEDSAGKISGHYELDNGQTGEIDGVRGIAAFQVSLKTRAGQMYAVQCSLNLQDNFIELTGTYFDSKTPAAPFYATAAT